MSGIRPDRADAVRGGGDGASGYVAATLGPTALLDALPLSVLVLDEAWTIRYANAAAVGMVGRPTALVGSDGRAVLPASLASELEAVRERAAGERAPAILDAHWPALQRWFRVRVTPVVGALALVFEDVTEERAYEEEQERLLRTEEMARHFLDGLLDTMTDAFAAFDADWRYIYVNREAERLLSRRREALLGRTVWEVLPDLREGPAYGEALRAQREQRLVELVAHLPSLGQGTWLRVRHYPIPGGMASVFRDVTSEKGHEIERERLLAAERTARAEAEKANRAKSDFLAVMSHELRTPLNAIIGYADVLDLGVHGVLGASQKEDVERIRRSAEHLLALVNDVLNFAKIEAGAIRLELEDLGADETVRGVEPVVTPQMDAKGLRYEYACADPSLVVRADSEKLQQVLVNLLSNATKYTDPGGTVRLVVEGDATRVLIRVHDTGVGIPHDRLADIFEPFVQVGRRLSSPNAGVGLGLAISRDLVRAMGGELTVESEVDQGSVFTLALPRGGAARD